MRIVNRNQQQDGYCESQTCSSYEACPTCGPGCNCMCDVSKGQCYTVGRDSNYSNLGGVIAPRNSAYVMPSMSNPNAERPVKALSTQIPSQTNLGGIADIQDFNPYNNLGTYKNQVNTMQNDQRLPKKFGGEFFTNVNLENPSGSPVLKATGVDYGGYLPPTLEGGKKKCSNKTCKVKVKSGGIFGGGRSLFGIGVGVARMSVPCLETQGGGCVCQGTNTSC